MTATPPPQEPILTKNEALAVLGLLVLAGLMTEEWKRKSTLEKRRIVNRHLRPEDRISLYSPPRPDGLW